MTRLIERDIKDHDCDHDWKTLYFRLKKSKGVKMGSGIDEFEFSYLHCPKCGSETCSAIDL